MSSKVLFDRPGGFREQFKLGSDSETRSLHYCPGCGHGILHKLIAEALADFDLKDRAVFIAPVGCAVFGYSYFNCGGISVPHGRAPAVATGIARANPENVVISYQGDGDLGAIGLAEILHAANRGENICVFFVNNAIYGMTGGQMAPTTLEKQRTVTTPCGRELDNDGAPMRIAEMIAALPAPVYVERTMLSTPGEIMKSRQAVRRALSNTMERKGFSFVEFLAGCPIGLKTDPVAVNDFIEQKMAATFPVGVLKKLEEQPSKVAPVLVDDAELLAILQPQHPVTVKQKFPGLFGSGAKVKVAGAGGQGILVLGGLMVKIAAAAGYEVSFLPSYGPEMRGGTANCSVVISAQDIASPVVEEGFDQLLVLNELSFEKYSNLLASDGVLLLDNSTFSSECVGKSYPVAASNLTLSNGLSSKCANLVMLGVWACLQSVALTDEERKSFRELCLDNVKEQFKDREVICKENLAAFELGWKAADEFE